MKIKVFTLSILVLMGDVAHAQVVRASLFTGLGIQSSANSSSFTWHVAEVSYAPKPSFDAGVYFDLGIGGGVSADGSSASRAGAMYGVQGKYYFLTHAFKPFMGMQLGLQTGGSFSADADGNLNDLEGGTKLQITPQAGFRVGPLNIWTSYRTGWGLGFHGGFVWGFGDFK